VPGCPTRSPSAARRLERSCFLNWRENPHMAERLGGASPLWNRPLAVSSIPYGYLGGRPSRWPLVRGRPGSLHSRSRETACRSRCIALRWLRRCSLGVKPQKPTTRIFRPTSAAHDPRHKLSRFLVTATRPRNGAVGLSIYPEALAWIARSTRIPASAIEPLLGCERPQPGA